MDKQVLYSLITCSNTVINLLIEQYNCGRIDFAIFKQHVGLKIDFLNRHLDSISDMDLRNSIIHTIEKCSEILTPSNAHQ